MSEKKTWKSKYPDTSQYIIIQVDSRFKNAVCWFELTSHPAPPGTVPCQPNSILLSACFDPFGSTDVIRPLVQFCPSEKCFLLYLPSLSITDHGYVTPGFAEDRGGPEFSRPRKAHVCREGDSRSNDIIMETGQGESQFLPLIASFNQSIFIFISVYMRVPFTLSFQDGVPLFLDSF